MMKELTPEQRKVVNQAKDILGRQLHDPDSSMLGADEAIEYLQLNLVEEEQQVFGAIFLDSRFRVIADRILFRGTIDRCAIYPREIVKEAIKHSAVKVILYSNDSECIDIVISDSLCRITETIREALALIDVAVVDRIFVSGNKAKSMAQQMLL